MTQIEQTHQETRTTDECVVATAIVMDEIETPFHIKSCVIASTTHDDDYERERVLYPSKFLDYPSKVAFVFVLMQLHRPFQLVELACHLISHSRRYRHVRSVVKS